jgi:hypothetical protein
MSFISYLYRMFDHVRAKYDRAFCQYPQRHLSSPSKVASFALKGA